MKTRIQYIRLISQLIFLGVWALSAYYRLTTLILILLGATLIVGNFFCSWLCPFGTAQDLLSRLGSLVLKKKLKMPLFIQKYLKFTRYLIFALIILQLAPVFLYHINAYTSFLFTINDLKDGLFTFSIANILMISYLLIGLFFDRPFCNYLCTEGVKFSLANITRIFSIKRNPETCIDCKLCDKACPMNINISTKTHVRDIQCINCLKCISACPKANTLKYTYTGWKR